MDASLASASGPALEGIFLAENQFKTGAGTSQLYLKGNVAALGGLALERDLGNPNNLKNPAELFKYGPDLILLYPQKLGYKRIKWQEVAP